MAARRPILRFSEPAQHGPGWEPSEEKPMPRRAPTSKKGRRRGGRGSRFAREIIHDVLACVGEFAGTFMFLLLAFLGAQSATYNRGGGDETITTNSNADISAIALAFGMSLIVTAWAFFKVTGAAFNPAVTMALWLVGGLTARRAIFVVCAQLLGGIAAAGAARGLTIGKFGLTNTLAPGVSTGQGLGIELATTAMLSFVVLMLTTEKSKSTFLAPVAIGLSVWLGHVASIGWTGAGMNPARSLGPSVITGSFPSNAWLYYVGQFLGSLVAVMLYVLLKHLDYEEVVADIDTDDAAESGAGLPQAPFTKMINAVPGLQAGGAMREDTASEIAEDEEASMEGRRDMQGREDAARGVGREDRAV